MVSHMQKRRKWQWGGIVAPAPGIGRWSLAPVRNNLNHTTRQFYVNRWHANVGDNASDATGGSNRAGNSNRADGNNSGGLDRRNRRAGNRFHNSPVLRIC